MLLLEWFPESLFTEFAVDKQAWKIPRKKSLSFGIFESTCPWTHRLDMRVLIPEQAVSYCSGERLEGGGNLIGRFLICGKDQWRAEPTGFQFGTRNVKTLRDHLEDNIWWRGELLSVSEPRRQGRAGPRAGPRPRRRSKAVSGRLRGRQGWRGMYAIHFVRGDKSFFFFFYLFTLTRNAYRFSG